MKVEKATLEKWAKAVVKAEKKVLERGGINWHNIGKNQKHEKSCIRRTSERIA